jgi:hypothetical protein
VTCAFTAVDFVAEVRQALANVVSALDGRRGPIRLRVSPGSVTDREEMRGSSATSAGPIAR